MHHGDYSATWRDYQEGMGTLVEDFCSTLERIRSHPLVNPTTVLDGPATRSTNSRGAAGWEGAHG